MLKPIRTEEPATTPVSLDELKAQLRVQSNDENVVLQSYLDAATGWLDGYAGVLGRCLISQGWSLSFPAFDVCLRLPFPDVSEVTISYVDLAGSAQTVDENDYQLLEDAAGAFVTFVAGFAVPSTFMRPDAVTVTIVAGYGDGAGDVPAPLRSAILLYAAHLYRNREAVSADTLTAIPLGVDALIQPFRRMGV